LNFILKFQFLFFLDIKDCLGDYFKKYNSKVGFTYDELDDHIEKIAASLSKDTIHKKKCQSSDGSDTLLFVNILLKHFINNRYFPLDEKKYESQEESEQRIFAEIEFCKLQMSKSHLYYKERKLDSNLMLEMTQEEEKYVYLINKLSKIGFDTILNKVLFHLKVMCLSSDFNDFYTMRIGLF
jgi:hypothetical protein